jgi:hypothetical protein
MLAKPAGVAALGGTIVVSGDAPDNGLSWGPPGRKQGQGGRSALMPTPAENPG